MYKWLVFFSFMASSVALVANDETQSKSLPANAMIRVNLKGLRGPAQGQTQITRRKTLAESNEERIRQLQHNNKMLRKSNARLEQETSEREDRLTDLLGQYRTALVEHQHWVSQKNQEVENLTRTNSHLSSNMTNQKNKNVALKRNNRELKKQNEQLHLQIEQDQKELKAAQRCPFSGPCNIL